MTKDPYEIARLIEGYLSKTLSDEEETAFLQTLKEDQHTQELLDTYKDRQHLINRLDYLDALNVDAAYQRIALQINAIKSKPQHSLPFLRYAASIAIICLFSIWVWHTFYPVQPGVLPQEKRPWSNSSNKAELLLSDGRKVHLDGKSLVVKEKDGTSLNLEEDLLSYQSGSHNNETQLYNTLRVPGGSTYKLKLSDGTIAHLNNRSNLTFPVSFSNGARVVSLQGEAYFEVAKNPMQPFKVKINGTEIIVLGTKFNVNTFDKQAITTLLEGTVKIKNKQNERILKPGQQATTDEEHIRIEEADLEKVMGWRNGFFSFNQDNIQFIMDQLSRWYDVEVRYTRRPLELHYSGNISRNTSLEEVLLNLTDITGMQFKLKEKTITVIPE